MLTEITYRKSQASTSGLPALKSPRGLPEMTTAPNGELRRQDLHLQVQQLVSLRSPQWVFGPFRLDPANACLWYGVEAVVLPPKVFDVLHYLVTHPDRLVAKDELLDAVWPETAVTDAVVRVAVGAARKA